VTWLRKELSRVRGDNLTLLSKLDTKLPRLEHDLKLALEANVVMRAECDQLRTRNAQLEIHDGC